MLAAKLIARRRLVALVWLVAIPSLIAMRLLLGVRMEAFNRLEGSESAAVEDALATHFGTGLARPLLLVVRGLPANVDAVPALPRLAGDIAQVPGVRTVLSPLDVIDTLLLPNEPGAALLLVGIEPSARGDSVALALRAVTERVKHELGVTAPRMTARWTGLTMVLMDLREASATSTRRAEAMALPIVLVVLLIAFRSVIAALLPLLFGVLAVNLSLGAALLMSAALGSRPTLLLGNVTSILGLALGIDYSLLAVTRFREALARGASPVDAAGEAAATAGHTILVSGSTVALGFAGLLLVPIGELQSVGWGGLVTALVSVALATTLLPAALSWIGARIDLGRLSRAPLEAPAAWWYRWGEWITGRPVMVLVIAGVPLVLLAAQALRLNPSSPREAWLPAGMESALAMRDLEALGRGNLASVIPVVLDLSGIGGDVADRRPHVAALWSALEADARVARVTGTAATEEAPWVRLDVIPRGHLTSAELSDFVRDLRLTTARASPGVRVLVGGIPAFEVDYEEAVRRTAPWVAVSVIVSVLLALSIAFRSVLVPLKATVLNLLSVGAGFGAMILVFQDGFGGHLFGLSHPLSGVFPAVPVMVFCIVFGLSMDYEVFLVARVAEARRDPNRSEREAIVEGVARTGRVITFAATLMAVIFFAFAFQQYMPSQLLGFALGTAIIVDATIVRLALGPALLQLAGRWNWWPGSPGPGARHVSG